jgi:hypothetical protein
MNTVAEDENEDKSGRQQNSLIDESSVKSNGYYTESASKFSLANSETDRINRSKFVLFLVILAVALTSSFLTFRLVSSQEQQEYETKVSKTV